MTLRGKKCKRKSKWIANKYQLRISACIFLHRCNPNQIPNSFSLVSKLSFEFCFQTLWCWHGCLCLTSTITFIWLSIKLIIDLCAYLMANHSVTHTKYSRIVNWLWRARQVEIKIEFESTQQFEWVSYYQLILARSVHRTVCVYIYR